MTESSAQEIIDELKKLQREMSDSLRLLTHAIISLAEILSDEQEPTEERASFLDGSHG